MKNLRKKITGILGLLVAAILFVSCSNEAIETEVQPLKTIEVKSSQILKDKLLLLKLDKLLKNHISDSKNGKVSAPFAEIDIDKAIISTYTNTDEASITIPAGEGTTFVIYAIGDLLVGDGMFIKVEHSEFVSTITFYNLDFEIIGGIITKGGLTKAYGIGKNGFPNGKVSADAFRCVMTNPICAAGLTVGL